LHDEKIRKGFTNRSEPVLMDASKDNPQPGGQRRKKEAKRQIDRPNSLLLAVAMPEQKLPSLVGQRRKTTLYVEP